MRFLVKKFRPKNHENNDFFKKSKVYITKLLGARFSIIAFLALIHLRESREAIGFLVFFYFDSYCT